ncbi:MATE family efflux transporter [Clostridium sp. AM58-1XD]|uniref:MATE family efflux transporter n=1 Tax=Clostridium sp. AM58-1XD TaxID=2292307 RepID=UPI001FA9388F|nr:MATE family efflux transporter [Clostridium sp. AM58-1XD]
MAVNYGAGAAERTVRTRKMGEKAAICTGIVFAAAGIARPDIIIESFVKPTEEIVTMAVPAVRMYFISFLATGMNLLSSTYFQSILKPGRALLICLMRGIVLNGFFVMVLPVFFNVNGIWVTMALTEFATLAAGRFMIVENK